MRFSSAIDSYITSALTAQINEEVKPVGLAVHHDCPLRKSEHGKRAAGKNHITWFNLYFCIERLSWEKTRTPQAETLSDVSATLPAILRWSQNARKLNTSATINL
jgi:hypothetical protein